MKQMTRKELYELFRGIYLEFKENKVKVPKCVVVNFRVPRKEQNHIFGYCLNEQNICEVDGYFISSDPDVDECSEISINPKILKMNLECIKGTIAHELIHTVSGCDDHNEKFLRVGKKVKKFLHLENEIEFVGTQEESDILWKL